MREKSFSPLALEQSYHNILSAISQVRQDEEKVALIADYIDSVSPLNEDSTYSFLLQIAPVYLAASGQAKLDFHSPAEITRYIRHCFYLKDRFQEKNNDWLFEAALSNLYFDLAASLFYVGDLENGYEALSLKNGISASPETKISAEPVSQGARLETPESRPPGALEEDAGLSNFALFHDFVTASRSPRPIAQDMDFILEKWRKIEHAAEVDEINCLFVKKNGSSETGYTAKTIPLTVFSKIIVSSDGQDMIHFHNASPVQHNEILNVASDALAVADVLYRKKYNPKQKSAVFSFSFADKDYLYAGSSVGLAVALLSYNQKLILNARRSRFRFPRNVAVTGNVDLKGKIEKIDSDGLKAKITSAFFSPLCRIIVPLENLREAHSLYYSLRSRYPVRKLEIRGVENIADVVSSDKILEKEKLSLVAHFKQKKTASLQLILGAFTLGLVLYGIAWLARNPEYHFWKDREPARVDVIKDTMMVYNKKHELLWTHKEAFEFRPYPERGWIFADLDGDGDKELVSSISRQDSEIATSWIACYSNRGKKRWEYLPGQRIRTDSREYSDKYVARPIDIVDIGQKRRKGLLVGASHSPWHPYKLALLNPEGKPVGEYWNAGHLYHPSMIQADLDGDGVNEVIIGGQNNGFDKACLVVLDPRHFEGTSPQEGVSRGYRFLDLPPGKEKYYLLFPQSILCALFQTRNFVEDIHLLENEKKLEVIVQEYADLTTGGKDYLLHYVLDYQMRVLECIPEDYYLSKLKELKTLKIISAVTRENIEQYKNQVLYWDGRHWTGKPALNEFWVK